LVEQRIENPCVGGSIPSWATTFSLIYKITGDVLKFSLIALLSAFSINSFATNIYVAPAEGAGIEADKLTAVTNLVEVAASEKSVNKISDSKKADITLKTKVIKLGNSYIVNVSKLTKNDQEKFSNKIKAKTFDDIDVSITRVVRSVLNENKLQDDITVSQVTDQEVSQGTNRTDAIKQWEFGFGPAKLHHVNASENAVAWRIGYNWTIRPNFDLKLIWDIASSRGNDSSGFNGISIGGNYFFSEADMAPFVTMDFGYGGAQADDPTLVHPDNSDASGFIIGAGGGMKFFRTSKVNLGLSLRLSHMLSKTFDGNPNSLGLLVSIFF
jgi:hypothetical protein